MLKLVAAPIMEPIQLYEAKDHLRVIGTDDDAVISDFIGAARLWCENWKEEAFITQTWDLYLDRFYERPAHRRTTWQSAIGYDEGRYIEIPKRPLQYIETLTYLDSAGASTVVNFIGLGGVPVLETTDYIIDVARGRLCLKADKTWPTITEQHNSIVIRFVVGYGMPADVPFGIKAAIKLAVGRLYDHRGDTEAGELPDAAKALLGPRTILA